RTSIHHEGARRAYRMTDPTPLSEAANRQLYAALKLLSSSKLRKSQSPVVLYPRGFDRIIVADKKGVSENGSDVTRISGEVGELLLDRKSTRLNSSHVSSSYAVFCLN